MKTIFLFFFVLLSLLVIGCSSSLKIISDPPEAEVLIDGKKKGITPFETTISSLDLPSMVKLEDIPKITLRKDGYSDTTFTMQYSAWGDDYTPQSNSFNIKLSEFVYGKNMFRIVTTSSGVEVQGFAVHSEENVIERSPNVTSVKRVTDLNDNRYVTSFVLSPDNQKIIISIFDRERINKGTTNSFANIWLTNTSYSSGMQRITQGNYLDIDPEFDNDGNYLYFSSNRAGNRSIWRVSLNTLGGLELITSGATSDKEPRLSPDGKTLLYSADMTGSKITQLWTTPIGAGLPTQLKEGEFGKWSTDGSKILFSALDRNTGKMQIWRMNADGSNLTQLSNSTEYNDIHPSWSPDGRKIIFASDRGVVDKRHNYDIWLMEADGSLPKQLTTNGSVDDFPILADDGKTVYFRSNRGVKWDIWTFQIVK